MSSRKKIVTDPFFDCWSLNTFSSLIRITAGGSCFVFLSGRDSNRRRSALGQREVGREERLVVEAVDADDRREPELLRDVGQPVGDPGNWWSCIGPRLGQNFIFGELSSQLCPSSQIRHREHNSGQSLIRLGLIINVNQNRPSSRKRSL